MTAMVSRLMSSANLVNFVLFQLSWAACVLGAAAGLLWPGLLAVFCLLAWQAGRRGFVQLDLPLLALALPLGFALDTLLVASGIVAYATPWPSAVLAPLWIMLLWMAFPLTLNHSLGWLRGRPWLAALLGGVFSPLSYLAGHGFGAVEFPRGSALAMVATGLSWALLVPWLSQRAWRRQQRVERQAPGGTAARGAESNETD